MAVKTKTASDASIYTNGKSLRLLTYEETVAAMERVDNEVMKTTDWIKLGALRFLTERLCKHLKEVTR